jgi:hypothetical protein
MSGFRLIDWQARPIGALLGRATVEIDRLVISDVAVFEKDGKRWTQLPAEPQRDRDGAIIKDDRGKTQYRSHLRWKDRAAQDAFSAALIAAIEAKHGPLEGGS